MRKDFGMVSENLNPFLRTINYEGEDLLAILPDGIRRRQGNKLVEQDPGSHQSVLGKNHPKYKADMLNCGEVKDSIMAK